LGEDVAFMTYQLNSNELSDLWLCNDGLGLALKIEVQKISTPLAESTGSTGPKMNTYGPRPALIAIRQAMPADGSLNLIEPEKAENIELKSFSAYATNPENLKCKMSNKSKTYQLFLLFKLNKSTSKS